MNLLNLFANVSPLVLKHPKKFFIGALIGDALLVLGVSLIIMSFRDPSVTFSEEVDPATPSVWACLYSPQTGDMKCSNFLGVVVKLFGPGLTGQGTM
jgi:hypothetical protein